jgi:hypothetical protein
MLYCFKRIVSLAMTTFLVLSRSTYMEIRVLYNRLDPDCKNKAQFLFGKRRRVERRDKC